MMLKNWFFKLEAEDSKRRLWAIALISLLFFFSFPVTAVFMAGTGLPRTNPAWLKEYSNLMFFLLSKENGWMSFLTVVLAVVCGVSGFSWLDSRKKVDFYHSIPVKREKLFAVSYINGILIMAVPYFLAVMAAAVIGVGQGVPAVIFQTAVQVWSYYMVYYLLLYATVILAVIMTGNLIVGLLGTGVFFFYGPVVLALAEGYFETWFYTYCDNGKFTGYVNIVSPFIDFCIGGNLTAGFFFSRLAAGFILTMIALFLYKKRPSEAAGKAMAFPASKPVIRILIVMASGVSGAVFLWNLRKSMGWSLFGVVTASLISHCVIEIIYNFDFKKLFSHCRQMAACMAVSILILCAFRYDWFGYDTYLPQEGDVLTAAVDISEIDDWVEYGRMEPFNNRSIEKDLWDIYQEAYDDNTAPYKWVSQGKKEHIFQEMKLTDLKPVLSIADSGIKQTREKRQLDMRNSASEERTEGHPEKSYVTAAICYNLKNGKTVKRVYNIETDTIRTDAIRIFDSTEYKEAVYPVLSMKSGQAVSARFGQMYHYEEIGRKKTEELLAAYQEDLRSMSQEDISGQLPVGTIRFLTEEVKALERWQEKNKEYEWGYYSRSTYIPREEYPVYDSFENTLALLKEENRSIYEEIDKENAAKAMLYDYRACVIDGKEETGKIIGLSDKDDIDSLIPLLKPNEYLDYNQFNRKGREVLHAELYFLGKEYSNEEDDYSKESYILDVDETPEKYLKLLEYDEMTKKLENYQKTRWD